MDLSRRKTGGKPAECKYQLTQIPDGWEAMRQWKRVEEDAGWRLKGTCPRCGHSISKFFPDRVGVLEMLRISPVWEEEKEDEATVRCNCTEAHEDREPSKTGCGAFWGIVADRSKDAPAAEGEA